MRTSMVFMLRLYGRPAPFVVSSGRLDPSPKRFGGQVYKFYRRVETNKLSTIKTAIAAVWWAVYIPGGIHSFL
jgi:tryptophan-rich sensory protein